MKSTIKQKFSDLRDTAEIIFGIGGLFVIIAGFIASVLAGFGIGLAIIVICLGVAYKFLTANIW